MANIDYNKIFAENATNQYNWEDSDYVKGLEILGQNPPIRQVFDNLFNRLDKKTQDLNNRINQLAQFVNNSDNLVQRETVYHIGDIVAYAQLPNYLVAECTMEGTTAQSLPELDIDMSKTAQTFTDGTATFKTRYKRMLGTFMEIKLWNGVLYEDEQTTYKHPVISSGLGAGLILMDWYLCDGKTGTPDTIDRTVRGHDGTHTWEVGGVDKVPIMVANLPAEKVQINAITTETTQGQTGANVQLETSAEDAIIKVKTSTGDNQLDHTNNAGLACVATNSELSDNSTVIVQERHKHSISGQLITPPHTHALQGGISLGSGTLLQIKNKYVNISYIMYIG